MIQNKSYYQHFRKIYNGFRSKPLFTLCIGLPKSLLRCNFIHGSYDSGVFKFPAVIELRMNMTPALTTVYSMMQMTLRFFDCTRSNTEKTLLKVSEIQCILRLLINYMMKR